MPRVIAEGYREEAKPKSAEVWDVIYGALKSGETLQYAVAGIEASNGKYNLVLDMKDPSIKGVVLAEDIGDVFQGSPLNLVGLDVAVKVKHCDRQSGVAYFDRASALKELKERTWEDIRTKAPRLVEIGRELAGLYKEMEGNADPEKRAEVAGKISALRDEGASLNYNRVGVIRWVLPKAAYADAGGVLAVIPAAQLAYGEVRDARRVVSPGEVYRLRITAADEEQGLLNASIKANLPDPWDTVPQRYQKGGTYLATVKKELPRSFLVEFEPGVVGFVRKFPYSRLSAGARCLFFVTGVDVKDRAISCRFVRLVS